MARGRWASLACLLVCRRTGLVVFKNSPVARPKMALRRVMGLLLRESRRQESKALLPAPLGISVICPASKAAEPRGAREAICGAGCHTAPGGKRSFCCEYSEGSVPEEPESTSVRVQTARLRSGSRDCGAVKLLSTQIVRKQAKALFISNDAAHCMQRRRQRFPTVRTVSEVGNGEVRAKINNIRACTSTVA